LVKFAPGTVGKGMAPGVHRLDRWERDMVGWFELDWGQKSGWIGLISRRSKWVKRVVELGQKNDRNRKRSEKMGLRHNYDGSFNTGFICE
jgi:hypothetical protein